MDYPKTHLYFLTCCHFAALELQEYQVHGGGGCQTLRHLVLSILAQLRFAFLCLCCKLFGGGGGLAVFPFEDETVAYFLVFLLITDEEELTISIIHLQLWLY